MKIDNKELHKLFDKIKYADKNAFSELYKKCNKLVYGIAFSILKNKEYSEDIVQNVFEKIYSLDKDKLPNNSEATWLYTVTKNEALKMVKDKHKTVNIDEIYEIGREDNEISKLIDREDFNKLISKLTDKEKEIITLKVISGFSFKEISYLLEEPIGTIKWRYYKSINTVKLMLSSFTISIVTFIIGLKTGLNKTAGQVFIVGEMKDENVVQEDNSFRENIANQESLETKPTTSISSNNVSKQDFSGETATECIEVESSARNINYFGIAMFSVSTIFFVLSIVFFTFFIKHQLKSNKKTSK